VKAGLAAALLLLVLVSGCGDAAKLSVAAGTGPQPVLPEPVTSWLPTVNIAPARGWPPDVKPRAAAGLQVTAFATGLDHPRWLCVLPNGDVLVAETNAPARPEEGPGIKGWIMGLLMQRAGAATPSANRILLLRDSNGSGVADVRSVLLKGLNSPFGMALVGNDLFVADTDAVLRFPYQKGTTRIDSPGTVLLRLPAGPINHHWTKNLIASADGRRLYVSVGSNSNVGERGIEAEAERAAVWEVDIASGSHRVFASGLRNPNGMAWEPSTGALWTVVNERDEIGSDLVPDYLTALHAGDFFGWPYSWFGRHVDERVQPPRPDRVALARVPDYALGPHTASLGLAAAAGHALTLAYAQGMFVGQHGSWNRDPRSGYQVIFVPFAAGRPSGMPLPVLDQFVSGDDKAYGRPVGVVVDARGALLVADDVGNTIWRVTARP
jgi:glucose/arabinose dehydrogenase